MLKIQNLHTILKMVYPQPTKFIPRFASTQFSGDKTEVVSYTQVQESNGVREIILSDLKTRNSLTFGMMKALQENLNRDKNCKELRCIVISAQGPVWSSGHNLKELNVCSSAAKGEAFQQLVEIIKCIRTHPVPVIAKVNGVAAAAGVQLMASCDLVISTKSSKFSTPGARFGIFCSTPGIALARVIAPLRASYMLFTGEDICAQEAYDAGLISKLTENEEELTKTCEQVTSQIISKSRAVVALGKEFFYEQLELGFQEAYEKGVQKMVENLDMCDGQEGLNSFLEKRKPVWTHK